MKLIHSNSGLSFILISAALHFLLTVSLYFLDDKPKVNMNQNSLEITFDENVETKTDQFEKPKKNIKIKDKIIVDQQKLNNDFENKAKFLSDHNQRVIKQTAALNHGDFQNIKSPQKTQTQQISDQKNTKDSNNIDQTNQQNLNSNFQKNFQKFLPHGDFFVKNQKSRTNKITDQKNSSVSANQSQTKDYLPDVEKGMETILSTQEFVYYTYYNRIRNQLNQYWEPKIKEKIVNMFRKGRKLASKEDQITKVLITLNTKGELIKVKILSESGTQELDEVALEAFKLAAPFPNPPKGIANENGVIEIRWDFVVET